MNNTAEQAAAYVRRNPNKPVRIHFRNEAGQTGTLDCTLAHAYDPNQSGRFFPTETADGYKTPKEMGWPVPYWYSEEIVKVEVL